MQTVQNQYISQINESKERLAAEISRNAVAAAAAAAANMNTSNSQGDMLNNGVIKGLYISPLPSSDYEAQPGPSNLHIPEKSYNIQNDVTFKNVLSSGCANSATYVFLFQ